LPWNSEGGAVVSPEEETSEDDDPFLTIAEELKGQQGAVFLKSDGFVFHAAAADQNVVSGKDTSFEEDDIDREISIAGIEYQIASVDTVEQKLTLDRDLEESIVGDTAYAIGPKAVGVPWRVRIPTSLVLLRDTADLISVPNNPPQ